MYNDFRYCIKCGAMECFIDGKCSICGSPSAESKTKEAKTASVSTPNQKGAQSISNRIDSPQIWMYIASVLIPVLQWILVGVYVSKNDMSNAFKLFITPLVVQIVAIIIFVMVRNM